MDLIHQSGITAQQGGHANIDAYNANTALAARFIKECEPFAGMLRIERFMGDVVFAVDK